LAQPAHHLNVFKDWPGREPTQRFKQFAAEEQALVAKRGVQPAAPEVDQRLHQAAPGKRLTEREGKSAASNVEIVEALRDQVRIARRDPGEWSSANSLWHAWEREVEKAGVPYRRNAFRNSYISYRLAILQDINRVAEETGTSPEMIRRNYLVPISRTVAEEWFAL